MFLCCRSSYLTYAYDITYFCFYDSPHGMTYILTPLIRGASTVQSVPRLHLHVPNERGDTFYRTLIKIEFPFFTLNI